MTSCFPAIIKRRKNNNIALEKSRSKDLCENCKKNAKEASGDSFSFFLKGEVDQCRFFYISFYMFFPSSRVCEKSRVVPGNRDPLFFSCREPPFFSTAHFGRET